MEALHHHDHFYFNNHKKSGQIPAFGNWDYANELPITQYFDCARQAGLIRYSSSSGDTVDHPYVPRGDFHAVDHYQHTKPHRTVQQVPGRKQTKRCPPNKEQKKQLQGNNYGNNNITISSYKNKNKVCDVAEQSRKLVRNDAVHRADQTAQIHRAPKPVDEDLYKIPPELLHSSKRKKRLGIFSRCLVPACTS